MLSFPSFTFLHLSVSTFFTFLLSCVFPSFNFFNFYFLFLLTFCAFSSLNAPNFTLYPCLLSSYIFSAFIIFTLFPCLLSFMLSPFTVFSFYFISPPGISIFLCSSFLSPSICLVSLFLLLSLSIYPFFTLYDFI